MSKVQMNCERCNILFEFNSKYGNRKYCSKTCSYSAKKKQIPDCVVCGKPTRGYRHITCSRRCANTHFRSGSNNGNWVGDTYRKICFEHYECRCIICGYDKVIDVHHYDGDKKNNDPKNLIPLCKNHHAEIHTKKWQEETKRLLDARLCHR